MELSKDDFEFFETAMTDQEAANILRNMIKFWRIIYGFFK